MRNRTLMDVGHSAMTARGMTCAEDVETGVTATGSATGDAYVLKCGMTQFSTVAASTGARIPDDADVGDEFYVHNAGANALAVYPKSGGKINNGAADASNSLAANAGACYKMINNTDAFRVA